MRPSSIIAPILVAFAGSSACLAQWTTQVVAFNGGQAAGLPAGVTYSALQNNQPPYLDPSGAVVFSSLLSGAATSADNRAVFYGPAAGVSSILRESTTPGEFGEPSDFLALNAGTLFLQAPYVGATTLTDGALLRYQAGVLTEVVREGNVPPVIETGHPANLTWGTLTTVPRIAGNGQIAFSVTLAGTSLNSVTGSALYMGPVSLPRRVVQNTQALPNVGTGTSGVTMTTLNTTPMINEQGKMLFSGAVSGTGVTGSNLTTYFLASPSGLAAPDPAYTITYIARRGTPAPGLPDGVTYSGDFNSNNTRTFDRYANLAYTNTIAGPGVTVPTNNDVLFAGSADTPSSITAVFREDDTIPGAVPGDRKWLSFQTIAFDGAGAVAADSRLWVRASLSGPGAPASNNSIIVYRTTDGTTTTVLQEGDPALPGDIIFGDFNSLVVNRSGTIVFSASLTGPGISSGNDTGLFIKRFGEAPVLLLREGDTFSLEYPGPVTATRTVSAFTVRGNNAGQSSGDIGLNDNDQLVVGVNFAEDAATTDAIIFFDPPSGACCVASVCSLIKQNACAGLGGVFQGPGSSCSPDPCSTSPSSVCCRGTTSILTTAANCTAPAGIGVAFLSGNSTVNGASNTAPCCYRDFNKDTAGNIDDIFIYLNAWFNPAANPFTKLNGDGTTSANIDDLFVFINVWFAGGCG